ncbi:hydrogenase expression/formation protein [Pontibacterium sp. N1Y112]|uniref:Hydrogenase expression/formation protein n=1 Tax=Pontibacterium sinense TaxID=2781979 RepID=A0A8J7FGY2_9GAMM|nr:hydrogenase expression/formation protein [Pontibacterium sinense]MBE9397373.1 hydrogenase expression/formation protein [Pontibacterium sinense]
MQNNGIELLNIPMGPGSQDEGDMVLDYMKMPSEMNSYDIPILPEAEAVQTCPHAVAAMEKLQGLLDQYQPGQQTQSMLLDAMPEADLDMLNQILGEGEVSVAIEGAQAVKVQETVMAGVWRLRTLNAQGDVISETLEVADIPACIRESSFRIQRSLDVDPEQMPAGVLNAPSVLVEIAEASQAFDGRQPETPHVINLSLLPFSPEDHIYLSETTGTGAVTMLSRGYGNCRITSTEVNGLWRVQYFNSTDQLILDTLEVTDIPAVACAAKEDLDDSAERLKEIREVLV